MNPIWGKKLTEKFQSLTFPDAMYHLLQVETRIYFWYGSYIQALGHVDNDIKDRFEKCDVVTDLG